MLIQSGVPVSMRQIRRRLELVAVLVATYCFRFNTLVSRKLRGHFRRVGTGWLLLSLAFGGRCLFASSASRLH